MTAPVVTIPNHESCRRARELFAGHPDIHHLVVVDGESRPVGILEPGDLTEPVRKTTET